MLILAFTIFTYCTNWSIAPFDFPRKWMLNLKGLIDRLWISKCAFLLMSTDHRALALATKSIDYLPCFSFRTTPVSKHFRTYYSTAFCWRGGRSAHPYHCIWFLGPISSLKRDPLAVAWSLLLRCLGSTKQSLPHFHKLRIIARISCLTLDRWCRYKNLEYSWRWGTSCGTFLYTNEFYKRKTNSTSGF